MLNYVFVLVTSAETWADDGVFRTQNALRELLGSFKKLCLDLALECCQARDDRATRSEVLLQQAEGAFSIRWPDAFMVCDLFGHLGLGMFVGVWHAETKTFQYECRRASQGGGRVCVIHYRENHFGDPMLVSGEESEQVRLNPVFVSCLVCF